MPTIAVLRAEDALRIQMQLTQRSWHHDNCRSLTANKSCNLRRGSVLPWTKACYHTTLQDSEGCRY